MSREAGIRHKIPRAGRTAKLTKPGGDQRRFGGGTVDWNKAEAGAEWRPVAELQR